MTVWVYLKNRRNDTPRDLLFSMKRRLSRSGKTAGLRRTRLEQSVSQLLRGSVKSIGITRLQKGGWGVEMSRKFMLTVVAALWCLKERRLSECWFIDAPIARKRFQPRKVWLLFWWIGGLSPVPPVIINTVYIIRKFYGLPFRSAYMRCYIWIQIYSNTIFR